MLHLVRMRALCEALLERRRHSPRGLLYRYGMTDRPRGPRTALATVLLALIFGVALLACGSSEPEDRLPADFPREQVPLLAGTVLSATGDRAEGWSVTVQAEVGEGNVVDDAVSLLTDVGYTEETRTETGDQRVVVLSHRIDDATYWVQVGSAAAAAGGGRSAFYQITVDE